MGDIPVYFISQLLEQQSSFQQLTIRSNPVFVLLAWLTVYCIIKLNVARGKNRATVELDKVKMKLK